MEFKQYLVKENEEEIAVSLGDILSSLQDLKMNGKSMGNRQVVSHVETAVGQIRRLLHNKHDDKNSDLLKKIQIIGVYLAKTAEEQPKDIDTAINNSVSYIEDMLHKTGKPINNLAVEPPKEISNVG